MTHTRHVVGLIALLLVGLYVVTAYAVVGPSSITDNSGSLTVKDFEPTDSGFVQAIKVVEDNDGDTLQVNSITIKNNASAPLADAGDIDKIEIYQLASIGGPNPTSADCEALGAANKRGETTDIAAFNSASGVTISLAGATISDNDTDWFCVKIITKSGLTPGRKIKSKILSASGIDPAGIGVPWSGGPTSGTGEGPEFVTKASGPSAVTDQTASGQSLASGQTKLVQVVRVKDNAADMNTAAITLSSLVITNLGTAVFGTDINRIEVYKASGVGNCDTSVPVTDDTFVGSLDIFGTPSSVTVTLVGATVPDDSSGVDFCIHARVTSTPGRTIRFRTTVNHVENSIPGSASPVDAANASVIEAAGFETFQVLGSFTPPATITSGESNVAVLKVQAKDGTSGDVNTEAPEVTSITINNLGTATLFGDITNIKIICSAPTGGADCAPGGTTVVNKIYSSAATFPQTFTGADILSADNDIDIPDDANATFEVRVTISSTPGNTIQLTFALSGTEGSLGSFTQGPVNHSQVTTIASGIGCEVLTDLNIGPATITSGSTNVVVQNIKCEDNDGNSGVPGAIVVNSITITNLGTANGGDIAKIQYGTCSDDDCSNPGDFTPAGGADSATGPITFPLTLDGNDITITDNTTQRIGIRVDVSSTIGNTIQLQTTLNVTEASQTITQGPVNDGIASTIVGGANRGCEAVTDLNVNAGSIPSGTSAIVQRLACIDSDPDSNSVSINQVNVRNLGDAVGPADVNKIEIVRMDTNAVVGSTTNTANFATPTGVNINVSVTVPDEGSVELGVRVYVTSTPGRTIQPRTTLRMFEGGSGPFTKSADDGTAETIAPPPACPTIVPGAPAAGQIGVFPATPATLTFTNAGPDGTGQLKTIRVRVQNRSSIDITVEDISEQLGEIVVVEGEGVTPTLPRVVKKNKSVTFFVKVRGPDEGPFPQTATRPYVDVTINCGGPTATQPARKLALPLEVKEIRAEQRGELLSFRVLGSGVQELGVQLFSLSGQLIADHRTSGATLTVPALTAQGQRLAKGVYLYVVTVRGWDGQVIRSEIRKIVVK
jgi:hypothetical protein